MKLWKSLSTNLWSTVRVLRGIKQNLFNCGTIFEEITEDACISSWIWSRRNSEQKAIVAWKGIEHNGLQERVLLHLVCLLQAL